MFNILIQISFLFFVIFNISLKCQELVWKLDVTNFENITNIEFLPDGNSFLLSGNGIMQIRSLENGALIDSIVDGDRTIRYLALSSDSLKIVIYSSDTTCKIYDLNQKDFIKTISLPPSTYQHTLGQLGSKVRDLHYNSHKETIYLIQDIDGEISDGARIYYYERRFLSLNIEVDSIIYEHVFRTNLFIYQYLTHYPSMVTKMAISNNNDYIFSILSDRDHLFFISHNRDNNTIIFELDKLNFVSIFETIANGSQLLFVLDEPIFINNIGVMNYLIIDINTRKIIDGFYAPTPLTKEHYKYGYSMINDSLLVVHRSDFPVIDLVNKKVIQVMDSPIYEDISLSRFKNNKILIVNNYPDKETISLYKYVIGN